MPDMAGHVLGPHWHLWHAAVPQKSFGSFLRSRMQDMPEASKEWSQVQVEPATGKNHLSQGLQHRGRGRQGRRRGELRGQHSGVPAI